MSQKKKLVLAGVGLLLASALPAWAENQDDVRQQMSKLAWQEGPATADLEGKAKLPIPDHYRFLDPDNGSKFLQLTGNLPKADNILVGDHWWAVMSFSPSGFVKDDEQIDADKLLQQMKDHDATENEQRRKLGQVELYTDGWYVPPHYDATTKQLEWGLKIHAANSTAPVINYTVRLLGRSGYESATMVSSPGTLDQNVIAFKALLRGFNFVSGEKYAEYQQGDHVAAYGLGALVLGGAAAVAVKTGFWKVLLAALAASWKLVAVGFAAAVASVKKFFTRKSM